MNRTTYTIPAMDCPTEEGMIRARLARVKGIEQVECDQFNRRLTVTHDLPDDGVILAALTDIGMRPSNGPLRKHRTAGSSCGDEACATGTMPGGRGTPGASVQPGWLAHGPLALSGATAVAAEGMALAGVSERSWPVVALALASVLLGGLPTLRKGLSAVQSLTLNINFLMTVAVVGACVIGAWPEAAMVAAPWNRSNGRTSSTSSSKPPGGSRANTARR